MKLCKLNKNVNEQFQRRHTYNETPVIHFARSNCELKRTREREKAKESASECENKSRKNVWNSSTTLPMPDAYLPLLFNEQIQMTSNLPEYSISLHWNGSICLGIQFNRQHKSNYPTTKTAPTDPRLFSIRICLIHFPRNQRERDRGNEREGSPEQKGFSPQPIVISITGKFQISIYLIIAKTNCFLTWLRE